MRAGWVLLIGISLSGFLAGCLQGSNPPASARAEAPEASNWTLLQAKGSPQGTIASFLWQVPPGAIQRTNSNWWPPNSVGLDIVPLWDSENGIRLESWSLLFFSFKDGRATLEGAPVLEYPYVVFDHLAGQRIEAVPSAAPIATGLTHVDFQDGDTIGIVLLVKTSIETSFPVAFRAGSTSDRVLSADEAVELFALHPPNVVPPFFHGRGYGYGQYLFVTFQASDSELFVGDLHVERPTVGGSPVSAVVRSFDMSGSYTSARGWSTTCGTLVGDPGLFHWRVDSTLRESRMNEARVHREDPWIGAREGFIFVHSGEGNGASEARYTVTGADATIVGFFGFEKLDLNATMMDLFEKQDSGIRLIREDSLPVASAGPLEEHARFAAASPPESGSYVWEECMSSRLIRA